MYNPFIRPNTFIQSQARRKRGAHKEHDVAASQFHYIVCPKHAEGTQECAFKPLEPNFKGVGTAASSSPLRPFAQRLQGVVPVERVRQCTWSRRAALAACGRGSTRMSYPQCPAGQLPSGSSSPSFPSPSGSPTPRGHGRVRGRATAPGARRRRGTWAGRRERP